MINEIFDIDLTAVGVIPDGQYTAIITDVEKKANKSGDGFYLNWVLNITEVGQNMFHVTSLKPSALFGLKRLLEAAGVSFNASGFNPADAIGKTIGVVITNKEDDFGTQSVVTKVFKL